jgi:hypothetical protein
MSDDRIKDEDRITRRDLLQANAILITGVLIFITLFKRETITSESIAFFAASLIGFFIQYILLSLTNILK